jgi:hypothetical protein
MNQDDTSSDTDTSKHIQSLGKNLGGIILWLAALPPKISPLQRDRIFYSKTKDLQNLVASEIDNSNKSP